MGGNAADNRQFVDAVLYRYRTGVPWRDLPARFGDWNIVYQRFNRWAKSGVFDRIFKLLAIGRDARVDPQKQDRSGRQGGGYCHRARLEEALSCHEPASKLIKFVKGMLHRNGQR